MVAKAEEVKQGTDHLDSNSCPLASVIRRGRVMRKTFEVYDKERKEIVDFTGGFAGGGLAIMQNGDLVFLGSLEWKYPDHPQRYEIRWKEEKD